MLKRVRNSFGVDCCSLVYNIVFYDSSFRKSVEGCY